MKITAISDLHGHYPELPGGDLLIVAGDLTKSDKPSQYLDFFTWIATTKYRKRILVAGNHDGFIEANRDIFDAISDFTYLQDSGCEFEGLKVWGSPHSLWFPKINPKYTTFTNSEYNLSSIYDKIPDDIDILISHGPPKGILDENLEVSHCGSQSLFNAIERTKPRIHVFGHIHESYGKAEREWKKTDDPTIFINASHVNEHYKPVNEPITVEI